MVMPMRVFLSHYTALNYWRGHFSLDSDLGIPARVSGAEKCASRKADVLGAIPEEFIVKDHPVDVVIFEEGDRRRSRDIKCHVWRIGLPSNAFYRVRGEYVSGPEFVFLQMAEILPIEQLIALGFELCGRYVLLPDSVLHPGSIDKMPKRLYPLTNTEKIAEFLEAIGKANGKAKAKRALKYVADNSRSPMETAVHMLLCMPASLGGYGLPKAVLNAEINLGSEEARIIARRNYCEGDLCWPNAQQPLDIEYHGEVHVGGAQMKSDVGRELGIEHAGWRVMTITSSQVFDTVAFEVIAKEAAKVLGKRFHPETLGMTKQRVNLRYELDHWMFQGRGLLG